MQRAVCVSKPSFLALLATAFVLMFLSMVSALCAANPGTVSVIDYSESSTFSFLDPMNNPAPWACSAEIPPGHCYANSTSGDIYIVNGVRAVDPKLSNNRIYYYVQLYSKGGSVIAGPAWQYEDASFVIMTAPRSWQGMRGSGLVLESESPRPEDFREWQVGHAIYDKSVQKFFVTATTPQNGSGDGYIDGYVVVGTSSDGIHSFNWMRIIKYERVYNYRMLAIFFYPDSGSCAGSGCQYSGVLTWLKHGGNYGITPIRYRPCFGSCANLGEIDIKIEDLGWRTFPIPQDNTGVNLGALGFNPERTVAGRAMGYTTATYGGVTQFELWRSLNTTLVPSSWAPCDPSSEPYKTNRLAWNADTGALLQYRRWDPVTGSGVDSGWINFTSPMRTITPAHYNMWSTWVIGRIDYGQENLLYIANRDNHVCQAANGWDKGTGKGIEWIRLGETLGTNQ